MASSQHWWPQGSVRTLCCNFGELFVGVSRLYTGASFPRWTLLAMIITPTRPTACEQTHRHAAMGWKNLVVSSSFCEVALNGIKRCCIWPSSTAARHAACATATQPLCHGGTIVEMPLGWTTFGRLRRGWLAIRDQHVLCLHYHSYSLCLLRLDALCAHRCLSICIWEHIVFILFLSIAWHRRTKYEDRHGRVAATLEAESDTRSFPNHWLDNVCA